MQNWLIALTVVLGSMIVLYLFKKLVVGRLHALAKNTSTEIDDVIADLLNRTQFWFFLSVSLFLASHVVVLPEVVTRPVRPVVIVALFAQLAIWGNGLITYLITRYRERTLNQDPTMATTLSALGFVSRIILWSAIGLMVLQNLGFEVDTLITGLGVGGIAVALAVQNILGDLFASLSIVLDKPFLIGDFIVVDELMGTVEHVGLKTTRIRSLNGEQLIVANSDLLSSRIRNYKRMQERRVLFVIGVVYGTPHEKLARIPQIVREIIEGQEQVRFDRAHFKDLGTYSLNFEVAYWMLTPDYTQYMDTRQAVNLALFRQFEEEGIEFAFPTQTLVLQKAGVRPPAEKPPAAGNAAGNREY